MNLAVRQIERVAGDYIPTSALLLGGDVIADPAIERTARYERTIVEAEFVPNQRTALNGPGAIDPWPIGGKVYAVTGWNPHGTDTGAEAANHVNRQIAGDVVHLGGRFVHGMGRAVEDTHAEPTIIAWDISEQDANSLGQRAAQDAIFEITAEEITVLNCDTGIRHTAARLA